MAKSKTGPALFDLISKDKADTTEALKVPGWWNRRGPTASQKEESTRPATRTSPMTVGDGPRRAPASVESRLGPQPFIELDADRFRISFTSVTAALAVFGLLVVLIGAFELGRRLERPVAFRLGVDAGRTASESEGLSEVEMVRAQPPSHEVIADLLAKPPVTAVSPLINKGIQQGADASPGWIRGFTYVVAQEFTQGRSADARQAQAFLAKDAIATELISFPSGSYQLITTQGYDRTNATQRGLAEQLQKQVRASGRRYYESGGGYKLEGYLKTLKNDSW